MEKRHRLVAEAIMELYRSEGADRITVIQHVAEAVHAAFEDGMTLQELVEAARRKLSARG
jgi:hypothetical protein